MLEAAHSANQLRKAQAGQTRDRPALARQACWGIGAWLAARRRPAAAQPAGPASSTRRAADAPPS
jgi:hypothetical protein